MAATSAAASSRASPSPQSKRPLSSDDAAAAAEADSWPMSKKPKMQDKVHIKRVIHMPGMGPLPSSSKPPPAVMAAISHAAPSTTEAETNSRLKTEFVQALPADLKELLQLEIDTMGDDWFVALRSEFVKPYFRDLKAFVIKEQATQTVFPPAKDIYSWSRLCPLAGVRVVVIGEFIILRFYFGCETPSVNGLIIVCV